MIRIKHLTKYYGSAKHFTKALEDINLTLDDKGLLFIVGKSGSGKSTLLNMIGGLDYPTSGDVIVDNKPLSSFSRGDFDAYRNSHIGIIFQSFNLIEDANVYENIALSLKIQAVGHDFNTIEDALQSVGLEGMGYRKINELSGGQKQRIAIARVLVKNPKIILADEPTGSLDSSTGEDIIANLKVISKNKLVIIVTHDLLLAQKYGDRIIEISDGNVISDLIKKENLASSKCEFVSQNVARIPVGGTISDVDLINSRLNDDKQNYLCITPVLDKIVLAHPSTFNTLYEKQDYDEDYVVNDKEFKDIDNKKLKLQKSKLPLNEALKMSFESLSKKRVRFSTLIFLATVALTLLSVATSLTSINSNTITASTIKANNERIISINKTSVQTSYFLASDYADIKADYPSLKYAKAVDLIMKFESVNPPSAIANYYFKHFEGVIESNDINSLGLKLLAGEAKFSASDDYLNIIISDYVASELIRQGFIGEKDGRYGIYFPLNNKDIIGTKILFKDGNLYNVKGVFETDYIEVNRDKPAIFKTLKDLYYAKAIVKEGFINNHIVNIESYFNDITMTYNFVPSSGNNLYTTANGINHYDKAELQSRLLIGELPDNLKDNEVVIDFTIFTRMRGSNFYATEQEVLEHWNRWYKRHYFDPTFTLNLSISTDLVASNNGFKIVAILYDGEDKGQLFFSDDYNQAIKASSLLSNELIMSSNQSVDQLTNIITSLKTDGYEIKTTTLKNYSNDTDQLKTIADVSTIGAIICGLFALLLIINFIISSIKSRQKEIGILRSCGARPIDVAKIFLSEIIITSSVVAMLAIGLTMLGYYSINLIVSNNIVKGMNVITFRLIDALYICALAYISMIVVALYPIIKISYLKPIDALNETN